MLSCRNMTNATDTKLIDKIFGDLAKWLFVRYPNNLKEQKIKFFNSHNTYNPQFTYELNNKKIDFTEVEKLISELSDVSIKKIYQKKLSEYKLQYSLYNQVGKSAQQFTEISEQIYGKPNKESLAIAQKIVKDMPSIMIGRKYPTYIRFKKLRKTIKQHLKKNRFKGHLVIRHDKSLLNHVAVSKESGNINISRNYIADQDELSDILYHELETHMRRLERSSKIPHDIFRIGTASYLVYEEGLATLNGHSAKKNKNLWHSALLLLAMDAALHHDFVHVFKKINDVIKNPFRSWSYTVRVKSGLGDTSQPGASTKDLYLQWLIKVGRELLNNKELLAYAYNGKASFKELEQFSHPWENPNALTTEDIKIIFDENHISY